MDCLERDSIVGTVKRGLRAPLTRRAVLGRMASASLAATMGASLLAACGGGDADDTDSEPSRGSSNETPTQAAGDGDSATPSSSESVTGNTSVLYTSDGLPVFEKPDRDSLPTPQRLVYAGSRDPDTLDLNVSVFGHVHRIMSMTYEPLVLETRTGEFVPSLAERWEVSEDGLNYTFTLKQGVKFHDGTPFNADAVKFAFDRIADPATQSKRAVNLIGPYDSATVEDEFTVTLTLKEPYAAFLDGISYNFCGIPSPTAIQELGPDYGRSPVGTGPMKFRKWTPQDSVEFERFEEYNWAPPLYNLEGPAYLEEFIYRIVPEEATRTAVLETGEVDIIDFVPAKDIERLQNDDNVTVLLEATPGMPTVYLLNTEKPPLDDIRVRQALIYAIDREDFAETISYGTQQPAYGPLAKATFGYNPEVEKLYPYDPEKAAALLDEAGWVLNGTTRERNGQKLELDLLTITSNAQHEYLQAILAEIGITVNILTGTDAWWQEAGIRGEHHLLSESVSGSDPSLLSWHFHSRNIGTGFARTRFRDARLDELLDEGGVVTDPERRKEIYAEVQMIIMENALIIPLLEGSMSVAMNKRVKNIALDARVYYTWMHSAFISE